MTTPPTRGVFCFSRLAAAPRGSGSGRGALALAAICCAGYWPAAAQAELVRVGPGERFERIADAAAAARDGDTVLILPGTYRGDVVTWRQSKLTIRGAGGRPVLLADGKSSEGKAIWVIRNGDFLIEGFEFRGARVADANGAGIRFERGRLEIRDCVFRDNQMGLLTANFADAELIVRDSEFAAAPKLEASLPHLLYVGRIDRFVLEGSHLHGGYRGHLLKSRARRSEIRYNLIADDPDGSASYEIDLPDGGDALLVGNVIRQSASSENPVIVAYGAEGSFWPENRLRMAHNTLVSPGWAPAWFVRTWPDRLPDGVRVETRNNLTAGLGVFELALAGDHRGNVSVALEGAPSARSRYRLPADSPLKGASSGATGELAPEAEFRFPLGVRALPKAARWTPGAFQSPQPR